MQTIHTKCQALFFSEKLNKLNKMSAVVVISTLRTNIAPDKAVFVVMTYDNYYFLHQV